MKSEWKNIRADEFCVRVTDGTHDSPKSKSYGKKLITSKHLKGNSIDFSSANWISDEDYCKVISRSKVEQWDILYSMIGTIGNIYLEKNPDAEYACKNVGIFKLGGDADKAYWLYYYLQSKQAQDYIFSHLRGSTQAYVPLGELRALPIIFPSEKLVKIIVKILKELDDKIALNQKINDNLEQQARVLFTSWFVDYSQFGGSVPQNWEEIRFEDFLTASKEKSDDPEIPMYSVTDTGIHPRDEKFKKKLSMKHAKNKVIHQNNLVFGMSREILNWGVMRDPIGGMSSAYNVYEVSKRVNSFYLEAYMKANIQYFKDLIKPAAREGQGIDKAVLMQKVLVLPPDEVLDAYYQLENPLREMMRSLEEENKYLEQIRDTLLPKLMSGEIDVEGIEL